MEHWHEVISNPTLADAILDCLIHQAYKIVLKGDSTRKRTAQLTQPLYSEQQHTCWRRFAPTRCHLSLEQVAGLW